MTVPSVLQFGVPGGPELLIVFLLFVLAFPAASLALGVGVGWWLRGRRGGGDTSSADTAAATDDGPTAAETDDTGADADSATDDAGADADDRDAL
ncbi:hypothetical protein [Haloparvum sedimenti]|uniref:hypothetical protein n=1 Tax=Haloparvum sedimenti TaxID=1678448 RepID=UPI00071E92E4|nr:hypothetical protein [Haloparvum sedimenti]